MNLGHGSTPKTWADREHREARERAEDALRSYAESMRFWNDPDRQHSRITLRMLVEEVIAEELPDA